MIFGRSPGFGEGLKASGDHGHPIWPALLIVSFGPAGESHRVYLEQVVVILALHVGPGLPGTFCLMTCKKNLCREESMHATPPAIPAQASAYADVPHQVLVDTVTVWSAVF